jgi:hypothetical protein
MVDPDLGRSRFCAHARTRPQANRRCRPGNAALFASAPSHQSAILGDARRAVGGNYPAQLSSRAGSEWVLQTGGPTLL